MLPLHQRIFDEIERAIMDGTWQPGQRIPYEHELREQYQCSRMTVSKALSALAERGMVVRRRRAGTFVAAPQIDRTVMEIQDIGTDALLAGHAYSCIIVTRKVERLGEQEAARLGVENGAEVLRLQCLHVVDGINHAIERRVIMLDAVPRARLELFDSKSPGSWLLEQVPWTEARHVIRAVCADSVTARQLDIPRGSACLVLSRQTWQSQRTVTFAEITHPGERYQFAGTFMPANTLSASAKQRSVKAL
jgi:GntR family histidine utilization transcriptional repressor